MFSNVLEKNYYDSPKYEYYSIKPQEFFTKESELPELTIIKIESQKIIKKDRFKTYKKIISERLDYLFANLDEDQDTEIFNLSKKAVYQFIDYVKTTKTPLISVDNVGNILFEWRDYNNYNIVMLLFKTNDTISLTGIKQNKCLIKVAGIISEVSDIFLQL